MPYSTFLTLFFLIFMTFMVAAMALQLGILHFLSKKMALHDGGFRRTLKVFGFLFLSGVIVRVTYGTIPAQGAAEGMIEILSGLVVFGISLAIIKSQFKVGLGRSFLVVVILTGVGGLLGGGMAYAIRAEFTQAFRFPTGSMSPAFEINDYVFAAKFAYKEDEPQRGDVVVFKYPRDEKIEYVKRVMGLPGETFEIRDRVIYADGVPIDDPWGVEKTAPGRGVDPRFDNFGPVVIPEGEYFVIGDNRFNSMDSRFWGTLPHELLVGKVMLRYWPLTRLGDVYATKAELP